jgi:glycogen phosphorylase
MTNSNQNLVPPLYYQDKQGWRKLMQTTIAMNGSFFNTQRMLEQYVSNAYYPENKASYSEHLLEQSFAR